MSDNWTSDPSKAGKLFHAVVTAVREVFRDPREIDGAFSDVGMGADGAPTTWMDRCLENAAVGAIAAQVEKGQILSEEQGIISLKHPSTSPTFVLDPLDGTANATMGLPIFALSLAIWCDGMAVAGCVYNYRTHDLYQATTGHGAQLNGRVLRISSKSPQLTDMCILLARPLSVADIESFTKCCFATKRTRITGCPSLDVCSIATGGFGAYIDVHRPRGLIHAHDIMAGMVILREAGGELFGDDGIPLEPGLSASESFNVVATVSRSAFESLRPLLVPSSHNGDDRCGT